MRGIVVAGAAQRHGEAERGRAGIVVAVAVLVGFVGAAGAQEPPADTKQQARQFYEEGKRRYNVGEFERAIEAWKQGYDLHPSADFLFNIAQAYRRKPDAKQALFFFRSYLREKPNAANRAEVETTISELEAEIERS